MLHWKHKKQRRFSLLTLLIVPLLTALALVTVTCDNFVLYDQFALSAREDLPLSLSPANAAVEVREGVAFAASGGTPDYVFSVTSGGGRIDARSGYYTAPESAGAATVRVADAAGDTSESSVTIVTPSELTIYPETVTLQTGGGYQFSGTGGTTPYVFSLSNNQSGATLAGDGSYTAGGSAGTDTVVLTDDTNSKAFAAVTVVSGGPLGISPTNPIVAENGSVSFSGYGGKPPYTFSIANGPGTILATLGTYTAPDQVGSDLAEVRIADAETPQTSVTTFVTVVPAEPTNLVADGSAGGNSDILLTWSDNSSSEDGYRIERKLNGGTFTELTTIAADSNSYTDGSCLPNNLYIYRVTAFTTGADPLESRYSNEAYDFSNS